MTIPETESRLNEYEKLKPTSAALLEALEDCINLIGQIGATAEQIKIVRSAEEAIRKAKSHAGTLKGD